MKKSSNKLRATIVVEWIVEDLSDYQTDCIDGAAKNTQQQYEDNEVGPEDILTFGSVISVVVEPVKGGK